MLKHFLLLGQFVPKIRTPIPLLMVSDTPTFTQRPWSLISIDFIMGLYYCPPKATQAFWWLWTAFPRRVSSFPCPNFARETAKDVCNHLFRVFGLPLDAVSDQGPQFTSLFWKPWLGPQSAFPQGSIHKPMNRRRDLIKT